MSNKEKTPIKKQEKKGIQKTSNLEIPTDKQKSAEAANWLSRSWNKIRENWKRSAILGGGIIATTIPGLAKDLENPNLQADREFANQDKNRIKVATDTVKRNGKTYIVNKYEIYGEKVSDKELENSAPSFEKIREAYINGDIRAYESVVINSRFKKLREGEFGEYTTPETIQYGDKTITVRLFKEGQGKKLMEYLKKAYGPAEYKKLVDRLGIDENSYETLGSLKRDQFVRAIVHGQNKEHSKWVYLGSGPGNEGTPFIGITFTKPDGTKDIEMIGLAECHGNVVFERVSATCEEIAEHNKNLKLKNEEINPKIN